MGHIKTPPKIGKFVPLDLNNHLVINFNNLDLDFYIYFIASIKVIVRTNLIARVSQIQGHEILVVLYARLDDDDCPLY